MLIIFTTSPNNLVLPMNCLDWKVAINGSLQIMFFLPSVVQNRICAMWFKGKELAFAFGCILAFSRLVSCHIVIW